MKFKLHVHHETRQVNMWSQKNYGRVNFHLAFFWPWSIQYNLSSMATLGTEERGLCREVAMLTTWNTEFLVGWRVKLCLLIWSITASVRKSCIAISTSWKSQNETRICFLLIIWAVNSDMLIYVIIYIKTWWLKINFILSRQVFFDVMHM